jgi:hypothetical protein
MSNESREAFEKTYPITAGLYWHEMFGVWEMAWKSCAQSKQAEIDQLRAELEKAVIPLIPEGYALVPIEPTDKMRHAFWRADERYENGLGEMPDSGWEWMLRAASEEPKP